MSCSDDYQDDFEQSLKELQEWCAAEDARRPIPSVYQRLFDDLDALLLEQEPDISSPTGDVIDNAEIALPSTLEIALPSIDESAPKPKDDLGVPESVTNACPVAPSHALSDTLHSLSLNPSDIPSVDCMKLASMQSGLGKAREEKEKKETKAGRKFARALEITGRRSGLAFSLNLGIGVEGTLHHSADPARIISDRLNRAFKNAGFAAPRYALTIEISPEHRAHVHGVIIVADQAQQKSNSPLRRALVKAGGKIEGRAASRQVDLKPLAAASGWHSYIIKDLPKTAAALGTDKLTFISAPLRRDVLQDMEQRPIPQ